MDNLFVDLDDLPQCEYSLYPYCSKQNKCSEECIKCLRREIKILKIFLAHEESLCERSLVDG